MTFHPSMESRIEGITVTAPLRFRAWRGGIADLWRVECAPQARGDYLSPHPRLFVALEGLESGAIALRAEGETATASIGGERTLAYVPPGLRIGVEVENIRGLAHLDIHFDLATLRGRMGSGFDAASVETPRLGFAEPRIAALARLLAAELGSPTPSRDAYGEGLLLAIFGALAGPEAAGPERRAARLAPGALQRVTAYLSENALRGVRVDELARMTGLSVGHLGHAFKASTGKTVQGWHAEARLDRVKALLLAPDASLGEVALAAGFADQAHLTRAFRRLTGTTPAAWRRAHVARKP